MTTFTRKQLDKIVARKARFSLAVGFYTGNWDIPYHPFIRCNRLCWQSTARKGTIPALHSL